MLKTFLAGGLGLIFSTQASAFHLGDHERVMRQAVSEFVSCHPEFAQSLNADWLSEGDRDEDLNIITKELFFSHFYHPGKHLPLMWRQDSAARLVNLAPSLMQCRQDRTHVTYDEALDLGHAIHHLQDMAVPAHVVPVMHSYWDSFETLEVAGDLASGWDCTTLDHSAATMETILNETALQTLNDVKSLKFSLKRDSDGLSLEKSGVNLWLEGQGDAFGSYGDLGNSFGQARFDIDGDSYSVLPSAFTSYKLAQLRMAVRASLRALAFQMLQN